MSHSPPLGPPHLIAQNVESQTRRVRSQKSVVTPPAHVTWQQCTGGIARPVSTLPPASANATHAPIVVIRAIRGSHQPRHRIPTVDGRDSRRFSHQRRGECKRSGVASCTGLEGKPGGAAPKLRAAEPHHPRLPSLTIRPPGWLPDA